MFKGLVFGWSVLMTINVVFGQQKKETADMESLLKEMSNIEAVARFPINTYQSLQASSYNRASKNPADKSWFADSDGTGYIREEVINGRQEYVIMEHEGPGCITRMWTPFFYYSLSNHIGPQIRIYLDGRKEPVLVENFIKLLTGQSFVKAPFAQSTTRAGVFYWPVPFAKGCKITLDQKPFYYCINYRAYAKGTSVKSYSRKKFNRLEPLLEKAGIQLAQSDETGDLGNLRRFNQRLEKNDSATFLISGGPKVIQSIKVHFTSPVNFGLLRNVLFRISFDKETTVWCPLGDFFCSSDRINTFHTRNLKAGHDNDMESFWVMPFRDHARIEVANYSDETISFSFEIAIKPWQWDERSMYFHANWVDYKYLPGDQFYDLNFIGIKGKGILVGDALTVLSPGTGWWGEGDEKIYINEQDFQRRFPAHFGTGTEDYYGWAGGEVPTGKDTFSIPFGSNVRNGNMKNPRGYNICLRNRILDIIPFDEVLKFDMEASPGVDIRHQYNLLAYSMMTYWYGIPGTKCNRKPQYRMIKEKLMTVSDMDLLEREIREGTIKIDYDSILEKINELSLQPE